MGPSASASAVRPKRRGLRGFGGLWGFAFLTNASLLCPGNLSSQISPGAEGGGIGALCDVGLGITSQ